MIQLFLNGIEVFSQKDTSIKITKENPILTDSGSYTLDVVLPLSIKENAMFFGPLNRIDVKKEYVKYNMQLLLNGNPLLVGTAVLTKVTEEDVTVQLLAGNSNTRFWNNTDVRYIDELDYNTENGVDIVKNYVGALNTYEEGLKFKNGWYSESDTKFKFQYADYVEDVRIGNTKKNGIKGKFCFSNVYDTELTEPDWNSNSEIVDDQHRLFCNYSTRHHVERQDGPLYTDADLIESYCVCVQPNLLYVVKKVIGEMGYTADLSEFEQYDFIKNIYIASSRVTFWIADSLPHWTIKEFLEEFQKLFNCTFIVEESSLRVSVKKNVDFASDEKLENIVDELEVTVSDDDINSLSTSNIKYIHDGDYCFAFLNEKLIEEHDVIEVEESSFSEFYNTDKWKNMAEDERLWSFYRMNGKLYILYKKEGVSFYYAKEVDEFGALDRSSDSDVELKMVPANIDFVKRAFGKEDIISVDSIVEENKNWTSIVMGGQSYTRDEIRKTRVYIHLLNAILIGNTWGGYKIASGSLYEEILGKDTEERFGSKQDYMNLFFNDFRSFKTTETLLDRCWYFDNKGSDPSYKWIKYGDDIVTTQDCYVDDLFVTSSDLGSRHDDITLTSPPSTRPSWSFSLKKRNGQQCIGDLHDGMPVLISKVEHQIKFLSYTVPNVRSRFNINGKHFVCKKVEYNINEDGIDPLMIGYFIEIQ